MATSSKKRNDRGGSVVDDFLSHLILGEVLARRGEIGPLARPWTPAGRRTKPLRSSPTAASAGAPRKED